MQPISFDRHRFPPEVIRHAVWFYARFTLNYRDIEDLLAERGLDISYETVRRWCLKFGATIARNSRSRRPIPSDHWHLNEMVVAVQSKHYWLWRAVDNEGEVLDFLVQSRERRAERGPPVAHPLTADVGAALEQEVFQIPQAQRKSAPSRPGGLSRAKSCTGRGWLIGSPGSCSASAATSGSLTARV